MKSDTEDRRRARSIEYHDALRTLADRVAVADNGIGIPEHGDRVFAPRARRVVQAHGGAVGITGTPGGGTTVWLDLPS